MIQSDGPYSMASHFPLSSLSDRTCSNILYGNYSKLKATSIDNILEGAKIANLKSKDIPGLFSPGHCVEVEAKLRIMKAIKLGHDYLRWLTLKQGLELTCSNFWWPLLVEALKVMEKTVQEFIMIGVNRKVICAAPQPERLMWVTKLLISMRKNYQYEILASYSSPILGNDNNPQQWWSINDYEILSATFQHEVETFLKSFSPYLPKEERGFEPATPQRLVNLQPTVPGLLSPKKSKLWLFQKLNQFWALPVVLG